MGCGAVWCGGVVYGGVVCGVVWSMWCGVVWCEVVGCGDLLYGRAAAAFHCTQTLLDLTRTDPLTFFSGLRQQQPIEQQSPLIATRAMMEAARPMAPGPRRGLMAVRLLRAHRHIDVYAAPLRRRGMA